MSWRSQLRPDYLDNQAAQLPSFAAIRQKNLETLYGRSDDGNFYLLDKSPKGSVDEQIQSLVNLVNSHPSFVTLSSCSGRIALFDPSAPEETDHADPGDGITNPSPPASVDASGKGTGRWILSSHFPLSWEDAQSALDGISSSPQSRKILSFRFEPMLLHVAASCLERGQQLLQLAFQRGFRESGLMVTSTRVTVAIRSYRLALTVPFSVHEDDSLQLPASYMEGLVKEFNERLEANLLRLDDLQDTLGKYLFQSTLTWSAQSLPDLNLWGHAAICVNYTQNQTKMTDVLVFGGYGTGPKTSRGPSRSKMVYRLRNTSSIDSKYIRLWDDDWEDVPVDGSKDRGLNKVADMPVEPYQWTAREGAAAILLPTTLKCGSPKALLFGGRCGPSAPFGDLILFDYQPGSSSQFCRPTTVLGSPPSPRWGHTLASLRNNRCLAFLVGGRTTNAVVQDSFYILSFCTSIDGRLAGLQWERIVGYDPLLTRYHHSTCIDKSHLFVMGGSRDPTNILEPFSDSTCHAVLSFDSSDPRKVKASSIEIGSQLSFAFGSQVCSFSQDGIEKIAWITSGGVSTRGSSPENILNTRTLSYSTQQQSWIVDPLASTEIDISKLDHIGPLVHHAMINTSNGDAEMVISVGGGSAGFAFQALYAKSFFLAPTQSRTNALDRKGAAGTSSGSRTTCSHEAVKDDRALVVYVRKAHAKAVKIALEEQGHLSHVYRMGPADVDATSHWTDTASSYIAIPIRSTAMDMLENSSEDVAAWANLVEQHGRQELPFRSAMFARKKKG